VDHEKDMLIHDVDNISIDLQSVLDGLYDYGITQGLCSRALEGINQFKDSFDAVFLQGIILNTGSIQKSLHSLKSSIMMLK
jgi:hypothetical protein